MKKKVLSILVVLLCNCTLLGCSTQNDKVEETKSPNKEIVDYSDKFQGINGCAVIFDEKENKYTIYNETMVNQQVSPCSTFKIVSTLLGLHNGVLKDETSTMDYNGTQYPFEEWNQDLTLKEAFQYSCVWYFRQVIDGVGKQETEEELKSLGYGNCDVSEWNGSNANSIEELNGFWLTSSLEISPMEQIEVLYRIFEGESIYSEKEISTLKSIMLVENDDVQNVYGKTGTSPEGEGWFVGFKEQDGEKIYFAVYLNDENQSEDVTGATAKEIALDILK